MSLLHGVEGSHRRVFAGTPEKVAKRRIIETVTAEGKPLYKAAMIHTDQPGFALKDEEVLITQISSDRDKDLNLVKANCSEMVVVVEALILLEEEFTAPFLSLGVSRNFAGLLEEVMENVPKEEKATFSRFCFAFSQWLEKTVMGKAENRDHVTTLETFSIGAVLFTRVGEQVAAKHHDNEGLKGLARFSVDNLFTWASLYRTKTKRHLELHSFKFVADDISVAEAGVNVLEYVMHKEVYKEVYPLLQVALPLVRKAVHNHQQACKVESKQRQFNMQQIASYVQSQMSNVDRRLREQ